MTPLQDVYDALFVLITDDMYMETTEEETRKDCKSLLMASLPLFEFPCAALNITRELLPDRTILEYFTRDLTQEEINILATGMLIPWIQRQLTSIELTRQKYSGSDFKMSSQASHLQRLNLLRKDTLIEHRRLQMLYSRRRTNPDSGNYESTFDLFVKKRKS